MIVIFVNSFSDHVLDPNQIHTARQVCARTAAPARRVSAALVRCRSFAAVHND